MARIALKQRIREIWQKLSHLNARPDQIAAGFSIGIFASFLPLNPSPIIVATVVAWLLKRNVIAAVAGAAASVVAGAAAAGAAASAATGAAASGAGAAASFFLPQAAISRVDARPRDRIRFFTV